MEMEAAGETAPAAWASPGDRGAESSKEGEEAETKGEEG